MKHSKILAYQDLNDLGNKINSLPSDEASPLIFEASIILLLAGFPDISYQGFLKLIQGELKVSNVSSLSHPIKVIIPALCYYLKLPCPELFSEKAMSESKLKQHIKKNFREYQRVSSIDRYPQIGMPSGKWSDEFLFDLTHPKANKKEDDRYQILSFLQELSQVVRYDIKQKKWQEASRLIKIFEDIINAWKFDSFTYIEEDLLVFGIRTYLHLNDISSADRLIQKYWQYCDSPIRGLYLVAYLPDLMCRISTGVLQNQIDITRKQAQEFLDLVDRRNYFPTKIGFIPSVNDWHDLLGKWNRATFNNINEEYMEIYEYQYPDILESQCCFEVGATEGEVSSLEQELGTKLPVSYRNFLLASNGFTIMNESCELYGIDQIKWFVEENRDWAECWDDSIEVDDEKYFQYGDHQDCCAIRGRYMETALQISSTEDGYIYLLNPKIIDSRNEWEAWDFGNKYPGAVRYRSFWEMMQKVYERSLRS